MLTYVLHEKNQELVIDFRGPVDERAVPVLTDLLLRIKSNELILNMQDAEYFNSNGIKAWAQFVKPLMVGRKASYINCSPDFICQVNMMPVLAKDIPILSFRADFFCSDCGSTEQLAFDGLSVKAALLEQFSDRVCSECQGALLPDEDPDQILLFKSI